MDEALSYYINWEIKLYDKVAFKGYFCFYHKLMYNGIIEIKSINN